MYLVLVYKLSLKYRAVQISLNILIKINKSKIVFLILVKLNYKYNLKKIISFENYNIYIYNHFLSGFYFGVTNGVLSFLTGTYVGYKCSIYFSIFVSITGIFKCSYNELAGLIYPFISL